MSQERGHNESSDVCQTAGFALHHANASQYLTAMLMDRDFQESVPTQFEDCPLALSGQNIVALCRLTLGSPWCNGFLGVMFFKYKLLATLRKRSGPICVVLPLTREFPQPVQQVADGYGKCFRFKNMCIYGGALKVTKFEPWKEVEVCMAAPSHQQIIFTNLVMG